MRGVVYGGAEDVCAPKKGAAMGFLLHSAGALSAFTLPIEIAAQMALL